MVWFTNRIYEFKGHIVGDKIESRGSFSIFQFVTSLNGSFVCNQDLFQYVSPLSINILAASVRIQTP